MIYVACFIDSVHKKACNNLLLQYALRDVLRLHARTGHNKPIAIVVFDFVKSFIIDR